MLKAHEVNTVYTPNGNRRKIMVRYLVIASSTPKAVSLLPLRDGEEVLRAEELHHIVIVENEHGSSESNSSLRQG